MKRKYDVIYSLGGNCQCAMILSDCSLHITSGPFDWLCKASFKDRFVCLFDEFNDFLNPDNFVRITMGDGVIYDNIKAKFRFLHDFHSNKTFIQEFPEFKEKYERRIGRFLTI